MNVIRKDSFVAMNRFSDWKTTDDDVSSTQILMIMANSTNTTTVSNSPSETNLIVYVCIHLVMPCAVVIGIIGNLLSILVFARREMIKFCVSIFTIVLALSDILLLITSLFNMILPDFLGAVLSDKSAFWCHFHGYFDLLFAAISGYSVVFISLERWFSIWKPFDKAKYVTSNITIVSVLSYTLISAFAFSWFPLTLNYSSIKPKSGERCQLLRPMVYKIFGTISVIFTYIAPFIFLGILNILIIYRLNARHNTSIQRSKKSTSSTNTTDSSPASASTRKRQQRQRSTDRHITFMLIAVAIAFMVMSFPFQIYWFYMQIRQLTVPNKALFTLTLTFRYLNCCCNFFLYSATSSLFRRELREIFQCFGSSKATQHETGFVRTTTVSPPALHPNDSSKRTNEQQQLLADNPPPAPPQSSMKGNVERSNLVGSNNGHVVSFKT